MEGKVTILSMRNKTTDMQETFHGMQTINAEHENHDTDTRYSWSYRDTSSMSSTQISSTSPRHRRSDWRATRTQTRALYASSRGPRTRISPSVLSTKNGSSLIRRVSSEASGYIKRVFGCECMCNLIADTLYEALSSTKSAMSRLKGASSEAFCCIKFVCECVIRVCI